jgi:antitoxin MazE
MRTKIQKWGNSLGLRIPRALAEEAGVVAGSEVDLSILRGDLIMKPAKRVKYRIHELLRQVTSKNIHAEVDADAPVGREVW